DNLAADRVLKVYNIHTGESVKATFFAEGSYQAEELQRLDRVLRDHRNGEINAINRALYDRIFLLQQQLDAKSGIHLISGYRSPATNEKLRRSSSGVAKKSQHMLGNAVDIAMPGISHRDLHKAARALRVGGVGYYPKSGFVHLDCARTRYWVG
ncbi:MAG: DUF882 domain-containing protein, partial [Oceanobacter sp.]